MPDFNFTEDDLDQSVLDALERRRQRREAEAAGAGGQASMQERLREALMQRRQAREQAGRSAFPPLTERLA